ncbi:2-hydroxyacid dehydrogenase family protein [Ezakiella peruensis]|uniref:2-hydroxyacid dehydrogenase family protein n=1 Tax=Ezakiella peruensis TaxID=1464038 RepID=UPI000C1B5E0B|nr:2-hydroxyacid dehydrogenase family protein [Ezakiella peruensis]
MKKVLITMQVPEPVVEKIKKDFEIDYNDSLDFLDRDDLIKRAKDAHGLLVPLSEKIDKEIIETCDNLEIIANFGAGFDNIDIKAAAEKNIVVTNAPAKFSTQSTAEIAIGLIIDVMRGITRGEDSLRQGNFKGWKPTYGLGPSVAGKTLGIFGMGRIGQAVCKRAKAFEMNVIYHSRTRLDEKKEKELGATYVSFDDLIEKSDVISLNSSYSKELHHLFNGDVFKKMKKTAYLVNTSRGPIIDEEALVKALAEKRIAGAGLDVYEFEPAVTEGLLKLDNVVLSPHLGNATIEAREEMGMIAANNIILVLSGGEAINKVN